MLTLFAMPKAFVGHIGVIQENAITSWTKLKGKPEIILFGNESGTSELAERLGVRHIADVAQTPFGAPRVDALIARAEQEAKHELLCYVNADIILMSDFAEAVGQVRRCEGAILMVGQRWDLDLTTRWDFERRDWETDLGHDTSLRPGENRVG